MFLSLTLAVVATLGGSWTHPEAPAQSPSPTPVPSASPTPAAADTPSPTPAPDAVALLAEADAHFARRSIGAIDEIADKSEIDAAIALYREALALSPRDIDILARLMRALHFRGAYTGAGDEEKEVFFDEGRRLGQQAVDRLEAQAKATRGRSRVETLRSVPGVPALYLWTAGHWGEWGLVKGKFTAARTGIAGKLRDLAQTVIDVDPAFEEGAGYRLLGRLHSEAPKIPFITGWVSHDKGLQYLRRAYQAGPHHPTTVFFLAEAILDHEPKSRTEALQLLEICAHITPRPDSALEDARYSQDARKLLDHLRSTSGS